MQTGCCDAALLWVHLDCFAPIEIQRLNGRPVERVQHAMRASLPKKKEANYEDTFDRMRQDGRRNVAPMGQPRRQPVYRR